MDRLLPVLIGGEADGQFVAQSPAMSGLQPELHVRKRTAVELPEGAYVPSSRYTLRMMRLRPDWPGLYVYAHHELDNDDAIKEAWERMMSVAVPVEERE